MFSPSSGSFSFFLLSRKKRSTFGQGGASKNVSKAKSSFRRPRFIRDPTVSQKVIMLLTCSNSSLPLGYFFTSAEKPSPSGIVLQNRLASFIGEERYTDMTSSSIVASWLVGRGNARACNPDKINLTG